MKKMIIVMRNDLNMRKGKMIAQGGHATSIVLLNHLELYDKYYKTNTHLKEWVKTGMKKICVRVDSEEELLNIEKQAHAANIECHVITDAGHTEFHGVHTKTCLALGPDDDFKIDAITGNLKPL